MAEVTSADVSPAGKVIPAMAFSMSVLVAKFLVAVLIAVLKSAAVRPGLSVM